MRLSALWTLSLLLSFQVIKAEQPNIILIFVDDLGYSDVGCYGNDFIDTPNIDQLAKDGVRFTDFYAAGAVCSPTRCAVQSGQNQARIGITDFIPGHFRPFERVMTPFVQPALPLETVTVAEQLKASGYQTGYIGKWHLGGGYHTPQKQGYDYVAMTGGSHLPGKYRISSKTEEVKLEPKPNQYRTDFEADLSLDFIQKNKDKPFFLMLSPYAVHILLQAMSDKVEKYQAKSLEQKRELPNPVYAAMVEHVDDMVGRVIKAVEQHGLTKKTMIVFTSDNGGLRGRYDYVPGIDPLVTNNAPLRGEKGNLYEGGIRVPLIVKYPGVAKAGSTCDEPTISYDFFPTFVDAAQGELPVNQVIDGLSFMPLLDHPEKTLPREDLHWHYPHYHHDRPASAIRSRDWKLIEYLDGSGDVELYHIAKDIGEANDLSKEKNGVTQKMKQKLIRWRNEISAAMPIKNVSYDPERAHEWYSRRNGQPINSKGRAPFRIVTEKNP